MKKHWRIVALVLVICLTASVVSPARAGTTLDPDHKCSLTMSVDFDDLAEVPIAVDLYRLASVDAYCRYTALAGFETLDLEPGSEDTDHWSAEMQKAFELIAAEDSTIAPVATGTIENMTEQVTNLETGVYLVLAHAPGASKEEYIIRNEDDGLLYTYLETAEYAYTVLPTMIALPSSDDGKTSGDEWFYDQSFQLKMVQEPRYGDLLIVKQLNSYSTLQSEITFVFDVVVEYHDEIIYSNAITMTFSEPGVQNTLIEHLPAGAVATVTECYSGASYILVSDPSDSAVIIANGEEGAPASVRFENDYNPTNLVSHGVINKFAYDGESWTWEAVYDDNIEVPNP